MAYRFSSEQNITAYKLTKALNGMDYINDTYSKDFVDKMEAILAESEEMSNVKIPFKTRVKKIQEGFFKGNDTKQAQCPVCNEWFNYYYDYDLRGVKLHIRKWASKEATAYALGEIKKMPHLRFWKENTRIVDAIPKNREWIL